VIIFLAEGSEREAAFFLALASLLRYVLPGLSIASSRRLDAAGARSSRSAVVARSGGGCRRYGGADWSAYSPPASCRCFFAALRRLRGSPRSWTKFGAPL